MGFASSRPAIRLTVAGLAVALIFAAGWWLPALGRGCCFAAGQKGLAPVVVLYRLGLLVFGEAYALSTVLFACVIRWRIRYAAVLLPLMGAWVLVRGHQSSGPLLKAYCEGLKQTLSARIPAADLASLIRAAQAPEAVSLSWYQGAVPDSVRHVFSRPPVIVPTAGAGAEPALVSIIWPCVGGGFGLTQRPPSSAPERWLDAAIPYGSGLWAVTRGE